MGSSSSMPPGWQSHQDPNSGRTYYVNNNTSETSWTKPAAMNPVVAPLPPMPAGPPPWGRGQRAPALPQFTTANPVAAAVASTTPVADQELPNWQMESNAETWSEVRDPNTGRNYYVNRHTNETSWTKPAAIAKPPPPRAMPPPALPQFSEHIDPASGRSYYVNNTTQETVWQLPRGATVHSTRTQNPAASFSAL